MLGQIGIIEQGVNLFVASRAKIGSGSGIGFLALDGLPWHEVMHGQMGHFAIAQLALHGDFGVRDAPSLA